MKANLEFHPSFFSKGDRPHLTEWSQPSLSEIAKTGVINCLDILAITSCVNAEHKDKRWENYFEEKATGFIERLNWNTHQGMRFRNPLANKTLYLIHGQEFKTDKGDVNILFADKTLDATKIPSRTGANFGGLLIDFDYLLDAAQDSGENPLVLYYPRGDELSILKLRELYQQGKLHALISYNGMEGRRKQKEIKEKVKSIGVPGIAVSDGHRLADMQSRIILRTKSRPDFKYHELGGIVRRELDEGEERGYKNIEIPVSRFSQAFYLARLANAIADENTPDWFRI